MFAIRAPLSTLGGTVFTAALFLGLWQLVSVPMVAAKRTTIVTPDFKRVRPDTPVEQPVREKPVRPPDARVIQPKSPGGVSNPITVLPPEPTTITRPKQQGLVLGVDRDTIPLVRVNPEYPPRAGNTEGWVRVRFTVTAIGTVRDAVIVASEPGTVFDDVALKAVARWRYNPRVEKGEAVERVGLETLIRFELEK